MPFQIALTSYQVKPPAVILLTAGADQQIFCGSVVTLTAVVDDEDLLPGHPLEWEQLEGNPVILDCVTCLTTTYPLGDLTDKTFRFWIDRGTVDEQYDDVDIFHTPTSICPYQSQVATATLDREVPASSPVCSSLVRVPAPPELQSSEAAAGLQLEWDQVERVDLRPFATFYTVYETGIAVQTTTVNDPREYAPAVETTYQILTEFLVNGQYSSELSCLKDFSDDDITIVIDDLMPITSQIANPTLALVKYGNITINDAPSVAPRQSQIATAELALVKYGNITINDAPSVAPHQSQVATPEVVVTRYSSGGIGG